MGASGGGAARLGHGHRPGRLEAGQSRVQRTERDVGEQAELVAEPAADLVAVQLLFVEQSEDGQVEHVRLLFLSPVDRSPRVA